jgi:hypothetical protein
MQLPPALGYIIQLSPSGLLPGVPCCLSLLSSRVWSSKEQRLHVEGGTNFLQGEVGIDLLLFHHVVVVWWRKPAMGI